MPPIPSPSNKFTNNFAKVNFFVNFTVVLDEHGEYGKTDTTEREKFDADAAAFCLAETLKEERLRAGLTQEQLAERIGTKQTYISRLENGKADV